MPHEIDFILRGYERRICANHGEDVYLWVGNCEEVERMEVASNEVKWGSELTEIECEG